MKGLGEEVGSKAYRLKHLRRSFYKNGIDCVRKQQLCDARAIGHSFTEYYHASVFEGGESRQKEVRNEKHLESDQKRRTGSVSSHLGERLCQEETQSPTVYWQSVIIRTRYNSMAWRKGRNFGSG
jgi:hypothetical protein